MISEPTAADNSMSNLDVPHLHAFSGEYDDSALGWECANPALQIERWGQDDAACALQ